MRNRAMAVVLGLVLLGSLTGCAALSSPPSERERTAAIGGLAGGATGAIIGSFAGSAVAGGLFGIPLGAVAGYFIGDQLASNERAMQARSVDRDDEIERLRQENERLRRQQER